MDSVLDRHPAVTAPGEKFISERVTGAAVTLSGGV